MAEQLELEAQKRDVLGKATRHLRREGFIPANITGHKEEPLAIQVSAVAFETFRRHHGARNVLSLKLDGRIESALVRHVQHNPRTGRIVHIDFSRVNLSDSLSMKLPLKFVGEAPGEKIQGGVFLHLLDALEVECRASDIAESLDVDISSLTEINAVLHAKDIKLPDGFSLITDPEELVAKIDAPRHQAETTPAATAETAAPATTNPGS